MTKHFDGGDPAEWPEDLRVREWPKVGSNESRATRKARCGDGEGPEKR